MAENERTFEPIAIETTKLFAYGECAEEGAVSFKYRWFAPPAEPGREYPLVVFLHGSGERGCDNELQVAGNIGAYGYALPENQAEHPCYVLAPQCPADMSFTLPEFERGFMALLQRFIEENAVDKYRVYLTGLSMGGMGTWHYLAKYPKLFAAALPICGGGDPYAIKAAKHVPVWACHAVDDPFVPFDGIMGQRLVSTVRMVEALRSFGGDVRMTAYPPGFIARHYPFPPEVAGHAAWEPAYRDPDIRSWLFSQDRRDRDEYELIKPGVWFFNDYYDASYYMVEGQDKALVIDTGMGRSKIMPLIRTITHKPVELAITHIHGDHMLHADEFEKIYIPEGDMALLPDFIAAMMPDLSLDEGKISPIKPGDTIDLGGCTVEAIDLAGHTPGSMVYADRSHKCLFTGDAIGSGIFVLMSVPGALCLSEYKAKLEAFAEKAGEFADFAWFGGHRYQERGSAFGNYYASLDAQPMGYNPLRLSLVQDMSALCEKLLSAELEGEEIPPFNGRGSGEPTLRAEHGSAAIIYLKSQLK